MLAQQERSEALHLVSLCQWAGDRRRGMGGMGADLLAPAVNPTPSQAHLLLLRCLGLGRRNLLLLLLSQQAKRVRVSAG